MTTVAIQGICGSYSEEAALLIVRRAAIVECEDFAAAFHAVLTGRTEYAVVPVENKIVGEIEGAMKIMRSGEFVVHERIPLKVEHVLAGTHDAALESIENVRSHVEALKQCRRYLSANSHWTQLIGADTASSVRQVVEMGDRTGAAIGSRRAAEIFGAKILAENVADDPDNWTAFCLVGI